MKALADRFEALVAALEERERNAPEAVAVRRGLEQTLAALEAAGAADGLGLAYRTLVTGGGGPLRIPLVELAQRGVTALLDHQAGLEKRRIIKVNHKVHFQLRRDPASGREVELGCLDCHRNIAHDKAQLETFRPRMASCFVGNCHRKDRNKDNCLRCHYQQLSELTARAN